MSDKTTNVKKLTVDDLKKIKGAKSPSPLAIRVEDNAGNKGEAGAV